MDTPRGPDVGAIGTGVSQTVLVRRHVPGTESTSISACILSQNRVSKSASYLGISWRVLSQGLLAPGRNVLPPDSGVWRTRRLPGRSSHVGRFSKMAGAIELLPSGRISPNFVGRPSPTSTTSRWLSVSKMSSEPHGPVSSRPALVDLTRGNDDRPCRALCGLRVRDQDDHVQTV